MHPAQQAEGELLADCVVRYDRRSGPGGQHRNKVETAVIITHRPSGIVAEANERRSQSANRAVALQRLRLLLALRVRSHSPEYDAVHASEPLPTSPSERWVSRTKNQRLSVSIDHPDFPALLAELLDYLVLCECDLASCAVHFAVTPSQLVKLLRAHPAALQVANQLRAEFKLKPLK